MGLNARFVLAAMLASGCLSSPPGADDPGDDGGPPDGEPCGSLRALSDEFEGGLNMWRWSPEGLWTADSGIVQLTPSPEEPFSALFARQSWMLDGSQLVVELDAGPRAADSVVELSLLGEDGEVFLSLENGVLRAKVEQAGFSGTRASVTFDENMHWWRIGRSGGRFQWATSSDGNDWQEHDEFDADLAGLATVAIRHVANTEGSAVTIQAINPGGAEEPACPLASFSDDFSQMTANWAIAGSESCHVDFTDRVEISLTVADACGLVSAERFSLEDSEMSIELAQVGDCAAHPTLDLAFAGGSFSFSCIPDPTPSLVAMAFLDDDAQDLGSTDWDQDEHRFLRIRHAPGEGGVAFETSRDRSEWNELGIATMLTDVDLSSVELSLMIYADGPDEEPVAFDELNTAP